MIIVLPLFNNVLVERIAEKETTDGGLVIPDSAREKPQEAEVIAVGPGRISDYGVQLPSFVQVGDRVLIPRYAGADLSIEDRSLLLVREEEIQAIVRRPKADGIGLDAGIPTDAKDEQ